MKNSFTLQVIAAIFLGLSVGIFLSMPKEQTKNPAYNNNSSLKQKSQRSNQHYAKERDSFDDNDFDRYSDEPN